MLTSRVCADSGVRHREAKAGVITKPHGSALGLDHRVMCAFGKVEVALTFGTAEAEGQGGKVGGTRRGNQCWVYCLRYMHPQLWFGLLLLLDFTRQSHTWELADKH